MNTVMDWMFVSYQDPYVKDLIPSVVVLEDRPF